MLGDRYEHLGCDRDVRVGRTMLTGADGRRLKMFGAFETLSVEISCRSSSWASTQSFLGQVSEDPRKIGGRCPGGRDHPVECGDGCLSH